MQKFSREFKVLTHWTKIILKNSICHSPDQPAIEGGLPSICSLCPLLLHLPLTLACIWITSPVLQTNLASIYRKQGKKIWFVFFVGSFFFCACFFFLLSRVVKDFMHVCFMQVRTSDLLRHPQEIWTLRTCNKIFSFKSCIDTAFLHFRRSLHASNSKQKLWSKW